MQVIQVQLWKRWVQPRSLYVGPAVIAIVGLIGFDLYGLGGLLFGSIIGVFLLALGDAAANTSFRSGYRPVSAEGEPAGRTRLAARPRDAGQQRPHTCFDLGFGHQHRERGVAQRHEAVLAGHAADRPGEPGLDEAGRPRPRPRRRSAASRPPPARARRRGLRPRPPRPAGARASAGRARARRRPRWPAASATRSDRCSPLAHVTISTSSPSPCTSRRADRDVGLGPGRGGSYGASQPPSPGSWRSAVW